jgi:ATP-binding cassette subfamily C (CFTR/MRP) protein 4
MTKSDLSNSRYALKLFKKGFKKDLEVTDLYEVLPDYRSKKLGDSLEDQWENQKAVRQNLSVSRLLWTCYGPSYILLGCVQVFNDIVLGM